MWSYKLSSGGTIEPGTDLVVKYNFNDTCYLWDDYGNKQGWVPRTENPKLVLHDGDILTCGNDRKLRLCAKACSYRAKHFMTDSCGSEWDKEQYEIGPTLEDVINQANKELKAVKLSPQYSNQGTITGRNIASALAKPNQPKKESMFTEILNTNKAAAEQAAVLETGRLANVTLKKIVQKRFPMLPETPFNALIVANLASVIATQVRPSPKLAKLTNAMVVQAYGEVYQLIDLEGMIAELLATVDLVEASVTE